MGDRKIWIHLKMVAAFFEGYLPESKTVPDKCPVNIVAVHKSPLIESASLFDLHTYMYANI